MIKVLLNKELQKMLKEQQLEKPNVKIYILFLFRLLSLSINYVTSQIYLLPCNKVGKMVFTKSKVQIKNKGYISIGSYNTIWSDISKSRFATHNGGSIYIGSHNFINGVFISANEKVTLGNNIKIGPQTMIMDSDFHSIDDHNAEGATSGITIEDDVWIGARCVILKGVTIGKAAVVGVGSVVTQNVPAYAIVAGVPAKLIRMKKEEV